MPGGSRLAGRARNIPIIVRRNTGPAMIRTADAPHE
jgi:hypothetical protein